MFRLITLATVLFWAVACSKEQPAQLDKVDKSTMTQDVERKPFYTRNPMSKAPAYTVEDQERRLQFPGWGAEDPIFTLRFPDNGNYGRVIMEYTMGSEGKGPADYDNLVMLYLKDKHSGEWLEFARLFTPFGGMFDSSWEMKFYLDITEYAPLLSGDIEFKFFYQGFDATEERAHTMKIKILCYNEGKGEILGMQSLYDSSTNPNNGYRGWAYGVEGHSIEAQERLGERIINIPAGTKEIVVRMAITGHGHDLGSFPNRPDYTVYNAAEFDDNYYYFTLDGIRQDAVGHIFYSNAENYIQMGTYNYDRANWAPGNPMNVQYWDIKRSSTAAQSMTIDIDLEEFVSSFDAPNAEGVAYYVVKCDAFFYR